MDTWTRVLARLRRDAERGASLVEHLFVVSLIAVVCMVAVSFFGNQTGDKMGKSADAIAGATVSCPAPGQINEQGLCEM